MKLRRKRVQKVYFSSQVTWVQKDKSNILSLCASQPYCLCSMSVRAAIDCETRQETTRGRKEEPREEKKGKAKRDVKKKQGHEKPKEGRSVMVRASRSWGKFILIYTITPDPPPSLPYTPTSPISHPVHSSPLGSQ